MEIRVLEKTKNKLKIEVVGEDHTLCNALRKELWEDKNVEIAGYNMKHPLISEPEIVVETKSGDPVKALLKAVDGLKKKNKELLVEIKNLK